MIKLQLDKDALERLIGRDSQVEIDLRSGIVQNFAKKYLKAVAQSELMCKAQDYVREHLRKELKIAGTWGVWDSSANTLGVISPIWRLLVATWINCPVATLDSVAIVIPFPFPISYSLSPIPASKQHDRCPLPAHPSSEQSQSGSVLSLIISLSNSRP